MNDSSRSGKTYYEILGVLPAATAQELESAFRKLAIQCHPDMCGDAEAGATFKLLREAYEVLADPHRRRLYDEAEAKRERRRNVPVKTSPAPKHAGGGPIADSPPSAQVSDPFLPWADLFFGKPKMHPDPHARSHPALDVESELPVTPEEARFGALVELKLPAAGDQARRVVVVRIPAGVRSGAVIRLVGEGRRLADVPQVGDLILRIAVRPSW
jgi:curved DNA-binding protein